MYCDWTRWQAYRVFPLSTRHSHATISSEVHNTKGLSWPTPAGHIHISAVMVILFCIFVIRPSSVVNIMLCFHQWDLMTRRGWISERTYPYYVTRHHPHSNRVRLHMCSPHHIRANALKCRSQSRGQSFAPLNNAILGREADSDTAIIDEPEWCYMIKPFKCPKCPHLPRLKLIDRIYSAPVVMQYLSANVSG